VRERERERERRGGAVSSGPVLRNEEAFLEKRRSPSHENPDDSSGETRIAIAIITATR